MQGGNNRAGKPGGIDQGVEVLMAFAGSDDRPAYAKRVLTN
jgi:hypothetical protein